eukprot:8894-Heterococcus_DN1.PRE.6
MTNAASITGKHSRYSAVQYRCMCVLVCAVASIMAPSSCAVSRATDVDSATLMVRRSSFY